MVSEPEPSSTGKSPWSVPGSYGYAGAIDTMGSISAPLLAALNIALAGLVVTAADRFHYVNLTLSLLVLATLALIATVQFTFRAKQFSTTPPEIEAWWPDHASPARRQILRAEQIYHSQQYGTWARLARWAYNVGILCSLLGMAALLVPIGGFERASDGRLVIVALPLGAALAEIAWIVFTYYEAKHPPRNWPDPEV